MSEGKKEKINVLSLFDGMSCGQQALERANIVVDNYFASEIDKYAIQVTMANYPDTKQLGSVVNVDGYSLPKIDLLIGGSPCQSFSFAGKRKGMSTKCETEILTLDHYLELKSEGYEFEGQSYLFWEFMRLLYEVKPKYFLLENVEMGEKWEKVLSKAIGVNGIHINSALVSAQNRKRIYWTNIGLEPAGLFDYPMSIIRKPKDKGILLKDILENEVDEKYFLSDKAINLLGEKIINKSVSNKKSMTIDGSYYKGVGIRCGDCRQVIIHNTMPRSSTTGKGGTGHLSRNDGKTYCLDTGNTNAVEIKRQIITHNIPEIVNVRKYEVNILELQKTLKQHKKLNNQQIADNLNVPKTMVEHWFRTDNYFSIPDKDIWIKLKKLLKINTNEFDESIMTFEEKESVFEKTNRVYDEDGIAPTLTSTSADERILVREVKQINPSIESGEKQPYQQNRVYDIDGISPALCYNKSDLLIKTLNENQQKKFNPNINSDKANALTLAQGRAGSSSEYMDSVSKIANITSRIRRLTPIECERLQTVKDNYTNHVSDSQRYKMLGNGWTVDVIAHIFNHFKF